MANILLQRSNSFFLKKKKKATKYHCSEIAEPEAANLFFILHFGIFQGGADSEQKA